MGRDCIRVPLAMTSFDAFLRDFRETVDRSAAGLRELSIAEAGAHPAPSKWSPKEIIGHLIDSASNNHGRFVRAQLKDDLVFMRDYVGHLEHHLAQVLGPLGPKSVNESTINAATAEPAVKKA